ncbi:hypothetical protein BRADI_4g12810v3 [Brachypodium distachyon]|nr:hypothetical protein BRADI_4g12810v3 [Brachypodium distachyon]PNT63192.1 hypothetical protein BRADI_4g12810v3 [Brachypodium distachyon]PNT63193.1 hypothetical protein BRADI_4g12810v3 [Brachypodium distachyon]
MTGNGQISTFGLFLSRGGDGCLSYIWLAMEINVSNWVSTGKTFGKVYMLQDGVWVMHTKAMTELPHPLRQPEPLLIGDRIYMAGGTSNDILVLDLANSSFFTIQLPEGVVWPSRHEGGTEFENRDVVFSRADDSGVYLIDMKELQLHIWLHNDHKLLLVDTICLREMCAALGMSDGMVEDEHTDAVRISQVGDNAEFLFLPMGRWTLYLDIRHRVLRKVYEMASKEHHDGLVHPFMMIWPPAFPALKDDSTRSAA